MFSKVPRRTNPNQPLPSSAVNLKCWRSKFIGDLKWKKALTWFQDLGKNFKVQRIEKWWKIRINFESKLTMVLKSLYKIFTIVSCYISCQVGKIWDSKRQFQIVWLRMRQIQIGKVGESDYLKKNSNGKTFHSLRSRGLWPRRLSSDFLHVWWPHSQWRGRRSHQPRCCDPGL